MGWVVKLVLSWLKQHKNNLILGVLVTVLGGIILYFIIPQSQANIVVAENTSKDWCQQTYGIKTPPKYIQDQSQEKCFYPLIYTVLEDNTVVHYGGWFEDDIYWKGFRLNIANLTTKYDLRSVLISIKTDPENYIMFSCNSNSFSTEKGSFIAYKNIDFNKEIFCGIVIVSNSKHIAFPKINISNNSVESEYLSTSLWNTDTIGYNLFSKDNKYNPFKPMNDYYNKKGIKRYEV